MKMEFEVTLKNFVDYKMYEIFNSRMSKGIMTIERVGGVLMFVIFFIMMINGGFIAKGLAVILTVCCSVPWVIYFPKLLRAIMRARLTLKLKGKKYNGIIVALGQKTIDIEKQKIIHTSLDGGHQGISATLRSEDIYAIKEEGGVLLLLSNEKGVCIIPLDAFESKEQKEKLLEAVH